MNNLEDKLILRAWEKGYKDFTQKGHDAICPYALDTKEAKCWIMGHEDAFEDYKEMEGEEHDL